MCAWFKITVLHLCSDIAAALIKITIMNAVLVCIEEEHLNEGQRNAVNRALNPDTKLLLIQGPPGKIGLCNLYLLTLYNVVSHF